VPKRADLEGKTFERLKVISWGPGPGFKGNKWKCVCSCQDANVVYAVSWQLTSGNTRSCGCLANELASKRFRTHGESDGGPRGKRSKEYGTWKGMISRCTLPSQVGYKYYGGKGIKVCKRWLKYENFLADMGRCPPGCSLDRKNNKKNYCKSNCRWATGDVQGANKSGTLWVRFSGKRQALKAWARELGFKYQTLVDRWHRGDRGKRLFRPLDHPGPNHPKGVKCQRR